MNVLYADCTSELWVSVAEYLRREEGWMPCYCMVADHVAGAARVRQRLREQFPPAVIHDYYDAIRGTPAPELADVPLPPLDQQLLRDLQHCECTVLKMMDKMDPYGAFPYGERVELYHYYLRY